MDRSVKYRQMLEAAPKQILYPTVLDRPMMKRSIERRQINQEDLFEDRLGIPYASDFKYMTLLAPNDDSLLALKDEILRTDLSIDQVSLYL